jgi:hypothetical protein
MSAGVEAVRNEEQAPGGAEGGAEDIVAGETKDARNSAKAAD